MDNSSQYNRRVNKSVYQDCQIPPPPPQPQPQSDNPGQLTNILQSLDSRLGKIESQLVFQNQQMGQQNQRIQSIEGHVEQITALKQSMTTVENKVYTIENDLTHIKHKQIEYDTSITTYSSLCDEVLKSQEQLNKIIDEINNTLTYLQVSEIENIKSEHSNLREDFLDTKCRQMCENLIFTGISEVELTQSQQENCERTLVNFLAEHMQIYDQIQFDRVHRLGRFRRNQARPRPIIAKFHEFRSKEMVKSRAPDALKNTNYGVREQYQDEYERRRKVLYPKMKAAKVNPENKVRLVKDTLYINNEKYICGQNNAPVKVVYQSAYNGPNFSAQTVPDNYGQRMPETQSYERQYPLNPQSQYSQRSLFRGPPPPPRPPPGTFPPPPPPSDSRGPPPSQFMDTRRPPPPQFMDTRGPPPPQGPPTPRPLFKDIRGPIPGTPRQYINFESVNSFGSLPRDDPGNARNNAGKKKASSPPRKSI